jgi:hypothetical protein
MVTDWVGGCNVECSDFDLNVCDEKGSGQGLQTLLLLHPGVDGYCAQSTYKDFLPLFEFLHIHFTGNLLKGLLYLRLAVSSLMYGLFTVIQHACPSA